MFNHNIHATMAKNHTEERFDRINDKTIRTRKEEELLFFEVDRCNIELWLFNRAFLGKVRKLKACYDNSLGHIALGHMKRVIAGSENLLIIIA
jgi:hypothetical protein